jgi:hypothetical protein
MLYVVQKVDDPLCRLVQDDPVRPEIPLEFRVGPFSEIFVLANDNGSPAAAICCAYRCSVPSTVQELAELPQDIPHVAVFYTIWSYTPGAGRKLINQTRRWIEQNRTEVSEFVTLSPPTDMARVFHLRNGADVFRVNSDSVNYRYP